MKSIAVHPHYEAVWSLGWRMSEVTGETGWGLGQENGEALYRSSSTLGRGDLQQADCSRLGLSCPDYLRLYLERPESCDITNLTHIVCECTHICAHVCVWSVTKTLNKNNQNFFSKVRNIFFLVKMVQLQSIFEIIQFGFLFYQANCKHGEVTLTEPAF